MKRHEPDVWQSTKGLIHIKDMSNNHIKKALRRSELLFIQNHRAMLEYARRAEIFETRMTRLYAEGLSRGIDVGSLANLSNPKYDILRNTYRIAEKCVEA